MAMEFKDVSFLYGKGTKNELYAIRDVNLTIDKHEYIGIIGHTGSGKSTLVQHMNGLNKPDSGSVIVEGINTSEKGADLKLLRQKVGLVFQYPEDQLFEETIFNDIAFGPKNQDLSSEEIENRVEWSMKAVGLDYEKYKGTSPFELSGGQKRRVAIAGVLALKPEYLVLDEPTAGLDPHGRQEILKSIRLIYENNKDMTIVLVTHSMEDIAEQATRLVVVDHGKIAMDGVTREVFSKQKELEEIGLSVPQITRFMNSLHESGFDVDATALTVDEAYDSLIKCLDERRVK